MLYYQAGCVEENIYIYCSTEKQALNTTAQQFRGSKQLPTMPEMQRPEYAFECNMTKKVEHFGFVTKRCSCCRRNICQRNIWPSLKLWYRSKKQQQQQQQQQDEQFDLSLNPSCLICAAALLVYTQPCFIKCALLQSNSLTIRYQFIYYVWTPSMQHAASNHLL